MFRRRVQRDVRLGFPFLCRSRQIVRQYVQIQCDLSKSRRRRYISNGKSGGEFCKSDGNDGSPYLTIRFLKTSYCNEFDARIVPSVKTVFGVSTPEVVQTRPPASRTISMPAAMSHGLMSSSQ